MEGTYGSIDAGEDEVKLSSVEAIGVGVRAVVVVDVLALSSLVERNQQWNARLEVRYVELGVNGVLLEFQTKLA